MLDAIKAAPLEKAPFTRDTEIGIIFIDAIQMPISNLLHALQRTLH